MFNLRLSIRNYIFLFFVLAVVVPTSIVGYLSYVNGQRSIESVLIANSDYEVKMIKDSLSQFLSQSQRINDLVKNMVDSKLVSLKDRSTAGKMLMHLIKNTVDVPAIEYADDNNELIGAYRGIWNRDFSMRVIGKQTNYSSVIYEIDDEYEMQKRVDEETIPNYDVRTSLPYKKAKETNKAAWTSIFLWPNKDFGIDFVSPVQTDGVFSGVIDASMNLAFIKSFVEELKIYPNTQVFILEKNGLIVSGTNVGLSTVEQGKSGKRVMAKESDSPILKDAVIYLEGKYGDLTKIERDESGFVVLDNKDYFLTTANFRDDYGIDWVILIAKLKSDYMGELINNAENEGYLVVVMTLLALVGAWIFARYITAPLAKLVTYSQALAGGNLKADPQVKRSDEMGVLADAFQTMAKKIGIYIDSLKEFDKLKDDFLSVASHELKSPLVPIKSQLQLLLGGDYGRLNDKQRRALEMVYRNEENLNRLTEEIFDIARINSKKMSLVKEIVSIREIVTSVVKDAKYAARQKGVKLELVSLPNKLAHLSADKFRLGQVIRNLLDNAIKFTSKGGKISVWVEQTETDIVVGVRDTGVGIKSENFEKLFTPFFQIEGDWQRRYRGTGLGLAIAKGIVEAHGGKIWVESGGLGKGSVFTFSLPIYGNM